MWPQRYHHSDIAASTTWPPELGHRSDVVARLWPPKRLPPGYYQQEFVVRRWLPGHGHREVSVAAGRKGRSCHPAYLPVPLIHIDLQ